MSSFISVTALELSCGFPFSQCVAHGNAEFLQTILGLVLRLVGLILISVLLCLLQHPINFGLRQPPSSPRQFWLIVGSTHSVQSSETHCSMSSVAAPTTSSSASQPHLRFPSLTSCSRASATLQCTLPMSCLILRAVHLTHLPLLDMKSRRFWRTPPPGTFRHHDTANHPSHFSCDSHLNRHVLAATSLVWPVTLAHHLVHLGNIIRRTCLLHSTRLVNTEASSNQQLLFANWVGIRTLVVAWKSRHTRVVLLGLAFCRWYFTLLHSEAPSCRTPSRPLALDPTSTRIVPPCFAQPGFQLGLSSRAPQDSTKRARSTLSVCSWLAFITMCTTQQGST